MNSTLLADGSTTTATQRTHGCQGFPPRPTARLRRPRRALSPVTGPGDPVLLRGVPSRRARGTPSHRVGGRLPRSMRFGNPTDGPWPLVFPGTTRNFCACPIPPHTLAPQALAHHQRPRTLSTTPAQRPTPLARSSKHPLTPLRSAPTPQNRPISPGSVPVCARPSREHNMRCRPGHV